MGVEKWSSNTSEGEIQFTTNYLQGCYFPKNELQFRLFETYFLSGSSFLCRVFIFQNGFEFVASLIDFHFRNSTFNTVCYSCAKKGHRHIVGNGKKSYETIRENGFLISYCLSIIFSWINRGRKIICYYFFSLMSILDNVVVCRHPGTVCSSNCTPWKDNSLQSTFANQGKPPQKNSQVWY